MEGNAIKEPGGILWLWRWRVLERSLDSAQKRRWCRQAEKEQRKNSGLGRPCPVQKSMAVQANVGDAALKLQELIYYLDFLKKCDFYWTLELSWLTKLYLVLYVLERILLHLSSTIGVWTPGQSLLECTNSQPFVIALLFIRMWLGPHWKHLYHWQVELKGLNRGFGCQSAIFSI